MTIHRLPNDHLAVSCDAPDCAMEGPTKRGVTEDELLDLAEERGWHVDREFGLHYCGVHTIHDCEVCGAPTASGVGDVATGEVTYYCAEHWPDFRSE